MKPVKRDAVEIDVWMRRHGLSVTKIQELLEFKNHGVVSNTIAGRKHNRKVLGLLLERGCPAQYLALPEDMKKAA